MHWVMSKFCRIYEKNFSVQSDTGSKKLVPYCISGPITHQLWYLPNKTMQNDNLSFKKMAIAHFCTHSVLHFDKTI